MKHSDFIHVYESLATAVWFFDLDNFKMLWGNGQAIELWEADSLDLLINRDFQSSMSNTVKIRLQEYKRKIQEGGEGREVWTFYPSGIPTVVEVNFSKGNWLEEKNVMFAQVVSYQSKQLGKEEIRGMEAIRHSNILISQFDYNGDLVFQNPVSSQFFSEASLVDRLSFTTSDTDIFTILKEENVFEKELFVKTNLGERWMLSFGREIIDPVSGDKSILLEQRDITNQKEIEEELKFAEARLVHSAKLVSIGEMAGGIAHEINNPAQAIQLSVQVMQKTFEKKQGFEEVFYRHSESMIKNIGRISQIIKGLQKFSREDSHDEFIEASFLEIINDVKGLCLSKIENEGVSLEVLGLEKDIKVICKPIPISQVLINILNNSLYAVNECEGERWIKIEVKEMETKVLIAITDSGPGFSIEIKDKIFNPFFTTKPIGDGTGLGLSISQGIIQNHDSKLSINESCSNTRIEFELKKAIK